VAHCARIAVVTVRVYLTLIAGVRSLVAELVRLTRITRRLTVEQRITELRPVAKSAVVRAVRLVGGVLASTADARIVCADHAVVTVAVHEAYSASIVALIA